MTATVLLFKQPKVIGTQKKGPRTESLYFCATCKGLNFLIDLDGEVWCGNAFCSAFISNLKVKP